MSGAGMETGLWEIALGAGLMVKFVLLVLIVFSIVSWAIIAYKLLLLRKIEKESARFYESFWGDKQFSQIYAETKGLRHTPLCALFTSVYNEFSPSEKAGDFNRQDLLRVERILKKTVANEIARLEHLVSFLATTGNTAPFIGLFGTVWGIMASFREIGAKGAASLSTVAPGISEALIATAMGLIAAIPASVAYNHIISKVDRVSTDMVNFSSDLLNIIEKQVSKKQ